MRDWLAERKTLPAILPIDVFDKHHRYDAVADSVACAIRQCGGERYVLRECSGNAVDERVVALFRFAVDIAERVSMSEREREFECVEPHIAIGDGVW